MWQVGGRVRGDMEGGGVMERRKKGEGRRAMKRGRHGRD